MELTNYIKTGILAKGSVIALGEHLGLHPNAISAAKGHRRGIPNDAAVKLAQLINVPALDVIAASELVTERNTEKREFWLSFANPAKAARVAGIGGFLAIVTNFVTQSAPDSPILRASGDMARQAFFVLCSISEKLYVRWYFCKSS